MDGIQSVVLFWKIRSCCLDSNYSRGIVTGASRAQSGGLEGGITFQESEAGGVSE